MHHGVVPWPDDWDARFTGSACPMCEEGRPSETDHGVRVFDGRYLDAYVAKQGAQRGYVVAIWRGRHVTDLIDLTADELAGYWSEVVVVANAMRQHYAPRKINYELLGNFIPHVHTHITARFADGDVRPGAPLPKDRDVVFDPGEVVHDAQALSVLLNGE
jgi:diadenosine tetraphosphate (Ap4A) HIT family hydrolase